MMLLFENIAALVAFILCLASFALGYVLRNWTDGVRAEWADLFTYRQERERKRTAYRRLNNGGF